MASQLRWSLGIDLGETLSEEGGNKQGRLGCISAIGVRKIFSVSPIILTIRVTYEEPM